MNNCFYRITEIGARNTDSSLRIPVYMSRVYTTGKFVDLCSKLTIFVANAANSNPRRLSVRNNVATKVRY